MTNPKTMTSKQLLATLQAALSGKSDKPESGFKTAEQWSVEWGVHLRDSQRLLRAGSSKSLIDVRKYRVACGAGLRLTPHYRPISY